MKAAVILKSSTLASDAACSFGCTKLSTVLCIGLILYEVWPSLWWVDAVTAILIALLVGYEGYETIKGAKDRDTFQGGCGCCGATDSGVNKYLREHFERQLGYTTLGKDEDADKEEECADACCEPKPEAKGSCGKGKEKEKLKEVRYTLYGAAVKDHKAKQADEAQAADRSDCDKAATHQSTSTKWSVNEGHCTLNAWCLEQTASLHTTHRRGWLGECFVVWLRTASNLTSFAFFI